MTDKNRDVKVFGTFAFRTENMVASTGPGLLLACPLGFKRQASAAVKTRVLTPVLLASCGI